jgi:hypothetical protein
MADDEVRDFQDRHSSTVTRQSVSAGRLDLPAGGSPPDPSWVQHHSSVATLRAVSSEDADAQLRRLANDPNFRHQNAVRHAMRFRSAGDVADLVSVLDDPHPCGMVDVVFALAGTQRTWLNWVPMPCEAICNVADEVGRRRAEGKQLELTVLALTAAEPASAITACRRITGPFMLDIADFPAPDIRQPVRPGRYMIWRYDGTEPVPAVPAPSLAAVQVLRETAGEAWPSPLSGYLKAARLGELPLDDLLGLLAHLPTPPDTPRWQHLAGSTPTYWYRFMQPWVCLGLLHHATDESWATSTRRQVLVDLAFGVEDWVADSALFAMVTAAYREPQLRHDVRHLVRARLDAAAAAQRLVTIGRSLAHLMLITPGCRAGDRTAATAVLARADQDDEQPARPWKRRWWRRRN